MKMLCKTCISVWILAAACLLQGCAAFRASTRNVDLDREDIHYKSSYDQADLRNLTEAVAADLTGSAFIQSQESAPIMMIAGYQNRTSRYVDTKNLTDRIRTLVFKTGKVRFVNEARREDLMKEQGFQAANVTPGDQARIGKQLGAKYMFSGSLTEMEQETGRQVRLSKKQLNYYKLTSEITDLETGELMWTSEEEFAREASKPLIGW